MATKVLDIYSKFYVNRSLLHQSELAFFEKLSNLAAGKFVVLTQVGMGGIFGVKGQRKDFGMWQSLRNKIERKRVDFLLCDPTSMKPIVAIELDGASHQNTKRQQRDMEVDRIFSSAGLPLIRVDVETNYDFLEIASQINNAINNSME